MQEAILAAREQLASLDRRFSEMSSGRWSERLNQSTRRLRQAVTQDDWSAALYDACAQFCTKAAIFTVQGDRLRLEKSCNGPGVIEIPLREAPAFRSAAETLDPVTAAATAGELSAALLAALGDPADSKAYVFPVTSLGKTVAALYAEGCVDPNALELLATLAGAIWESRSGSGTPANGLVSIGSPDQELHRKAERFARVQIAELLLYKAQEVRQGRSQRALYSVLQEEIDRGRAAFAAEFVQDCPSMVDYYHKELVQKLANDDVALLGPDYPGPVV